MKFQLDCYSCLLRQALQAARFAGADEPTCSQVMQDTLAMLQRDAQTRYPLDISANMLRIVIDHTGLEDPYAEQKRACNNEALRLLPELRDQLASAADPLGFALKAAVIGNIMDYGANAEFDVSSLVSTLNEREFALSARGELSDRLTTARTISYFTDNAGEIVFDRLLIEYLLSAFPLEEIRLVVRSRPFLNDICETDLEPLGFDALDRVRVLSVPVAPSERDEEQWARAIDSDIVLTKGMANYENYGDEDGFYFLLIVKCDLVARLMSEQTGRDVAEGDWVLLHRAVS